MNYWDSVGRWINTLLVFIVGVLAFDALFRLLEANEANIIVSSVRALSVAFLVPFQGMFGEQDFVLTTLIGVLGYALLAGIALGVLRSLQASRAQPAPSVEPEPRHQAGDATPPPAARRAQAPAAQAPATPERRDPRPAADRREPRSAAPMSASDRRDDQRQERPRSQSEATPPPEPGRSGERGGGQRRANGRQRRARSGSDPREAPTRGTQTPNRPAGGQGAARGPNGNRGS
ncbi:hypothetical protein BH23ACT10_BH23ACT10_34540 [soil metagenome]